LVPDPDPQETQAPAVSLKKPSLQVVQAEAEEQSAHPAAQAVQEVTWASANQPVAQAEQVALAVTDPSVQVPQLATMEVQVTQAPSLKVTPVPWHFSHLVSLFWVIKLARGATHLASLEEDPAMVLMFPTLQVVMV
jgi:hypothetical protein